MGTVFGAFLAVVSLVVFSGADALAARQPNGAERKGLMDAISRVRKNGYDQPAADLSRKLALGALLVEDSWPSGMWGLTNYPILGEQTITVNAQAIPDPSASYYTKLKNGAVELLADRVWLAAILAHEWYHTTQSALWIRTIGRNEGARERPAWQYQADFLSRAVNRFSQGDKAASQRLQDLVERAQEEVNAR